MVGGTNINRILSLRWPGAVSSRQNVKDYAASQNECDVVQRAAEGDSEALAQLYDRYAPKLYRVLVAILQSNEDAEDALQEVFLRLSNGRMKAARDVRSYLHSSARNIALDILRRRKKETSWDECEIAETIQTPSSNLLELLHFLPTQQREVIALKVFEEMTFAEIAAVVNASPNTVASRYRYGIEKLREWAREGDADE